MRKSGRMGNARVYYDSLNSLKRYNRNRYLDFKNIDYKFLNKYETYLRSRRGNDGGIGVKMRAIRALFNLAIKYNIISENLYPFKLYKISKLKSRSVKKALTLEEINRDCQSRS